MGPDSVSRGAVLKLAVHASWLSHAACFACGNPLHAECPAVSYDRCIHSLVVGAEMRLDFKASDGIAERCIIYHPDQLADCRCRCRSGCLHNHPIAELKAVCSRRLDG